MLTVVLGIAGFVAAGFAAAFLRARSAQLSLWSAAARLLGLRSSGGLLGPMLEGEIRGVKVAATCRHDSATSSTLVMATAPGLPAREVVPLVLRRLDLPRPDADRPLEAVENGLLQTLPVQWLTPTDLAAHVEQVVLAVEKVVAAPVPALLLANLEREVDAGVRRASLRALVDHHRSARETALAIHLAAGDSDAEVRRLAAFEAGATALETFALDPRNSPEHRRDALVRLEATAEPDRYSALLGRALDAKGGLVFVHALKAVARRRDASHVERLVALACADPDPDSADTLASTLGALEARSEKAMIALLRSPNGSARLTALCELGEWASAAAVEPLLGLRDDGYLWGAAEVAIRKIQSRLAGAEAGGVSVVESFPEGGVSLPRGEKERS